MSLIKVCVDAWDASPHTRGAYAPAAELLIDVDCDYAFGHDPREDWMADLCERIGVSEVPAEWR